MSCLPKLIPDVESIIFSHLQEVPDILHCLRVCKKWRQSIPTYIIKLKWHSCGEDRVVPLYFFQSLTSLRRMSVPVMIRDIYELSRLCGLPNMHYEKLSIMITEDIEDMGLSEILAAFPSNVKLRIEEYVDWGESPLYAFSSYNLVEIHNGYVGIYNRNCEITAGLLNKVRRQRLITSFVTNYHLLDDIVAELGEVQTLESIETEMPGSFEEDFVSAVSLAMRLPSLKRVCYRMWHVNEDFMLQEENITHLQPIERVFDFEAPFPLDFVPTVLRLFPRLRRLHIYVSCLVTLSWMQCKNILEYSKRIPTTLRVDNAIETRDNEVFSKYHPDIEVRRLID